MIVTGYLLVLIYTGMSITTMPEDSMDGCLAHAQAMVGQKAFVTAWDTMGGLHPIPTVDLAFCVQGALSKPAEVK